MSLVHKDLIDKLIPLVLKDAENKKLDAGMGGRWDDGGASRLEDQVKFFQYGMRGQIPPEWKEYEKLLDPEYIEYLRLKRKFG